MATLPPSPNPRWTAAAACALAAGGLLVASASPAWAHNTLVGSSPEDGQDLDEAPTEVELEFDQEVMEGGNGIVVTGPDGSSTYESGEVEIDGEFASIALGELDEAGDYSIDYRIISADGHPVEGALGFSLSGDALHTQDDAVGQDDDEEAGDGEPARSDDDPAAEEEPEGLGMPAWVAVVLAVALIGVIVTILVRLSRRN
jgi:copper resistance protein C